MAKLTGPLLSFGARGAVGKTLVASNWRGVSYARQYVTPANPRSTAQQHVRAIFALLREMWKLAPTDVVDTWDLFAQGRPFTGMNKFVGENVRVLNGETDMQNMIFSPGARGGLAPVSIAAVTGGSAGEVDVTVTAPTAPDGWTITKAIAAGFTDQAPDGFFETPFAAGSDASAPYEITLTGLATGQLAVVGAWLEWVKSDGRTAYSVSLTDTATAG